MIYENFEDLTIQQIRNEILKFKNDPISQKLANYYTSKSLAEIYGNSRKEVAHSNFIGWLLDSNESHGLGQFPLEKFLEILVIASHGKHYENHRALFDSVISGDIKLSDIKVVLEKNLPGIGRLDIYVETLVKTSNSQFPLRVVIENKVQTKEHSDQTTAYASYFNGGSDSEYKTLFVYLTALSGIELSELQEREEVECSSKKFIQINYQYLVDYLIEPALSKELPNKIRFLIKDYLQSLSQPALSEDSDSFKQDLVMAIGNEERELLSKFWKQNQKLILSAIYAISTDPEQDLDTRETANKLISEISQEGKDRSKIDIYLNDELKVKDIIKANIGLKTIKLIESSGLIDEEVFQFFRNDFSCGFQLLKKSEEVSENERKYKKYRVHKQPEFIYGDCEYYVARNWGITNIFKFVEACEKKFPELRFDVKQ